ncbi:MAG TPA: hypothetical protein VGJ48_17670 [Pyrinomonadaceae bacterium]|jgi:hypothetical protein
MLTIGRWLLGKEKLRPADDSIDFAVVDVAEKPVERLKKALTYYAPSPRS